MTYANFLNTKVVIAEQGGFAPPPAHNNLFPHQADITDWAIQGGQRMVAASFGLGKSVMQLRVALECIKKTGKPSLIVCPLSVVTEFQNDAQIIAIHSPAYITEQSQVDEAGIYLTNYERIREGNFDPKAFGCVCLDEASILRNLETKTSDVFQSNWSRVPYRFVFTATPAPNAYLELLNYAEFLGVMDRGQALTRFFKRDSQKAGNLKLHPQRAEEFWFWVASWGCIIRTPSDLGHSDKGYKLPPMNVQYHRITVKGREKVVDSRGQIGALPNEAKGLSGQARERRVSMDDRIKKAVDIAKAAPDEHIIFWHDTNAERKALAKSLPADKYVIVTGSMTPEAKAEALARFAQGKVQYLLAKPSIAGQGCNLQYHCYRAVFLSVSYKFNDCIQAVHRIYRFGQSQACQVDFIYTDAEESVRRTFERKWKGHDRLQETVSAIVREHGLGAETYREQLRRTMFEQRQEATGDGYKIVNNDAVLEWENVETDSMGLILTSVPFGNHYEYSASYNDMGHNLDNARFMRQLGYLSTNMQRALKPGRIMAIHVKDRIRYGYQTGAGGYTLEPFSDDVCRHFRDIDGLDFIGRITVTTDVVQENNQTYRLGYSEKVKDGSKMSVGLPEYILLFRKRPTDTSNSYGDEPVELCRETYTLGRWQLDADSRWGSNGRRYISREVLEKMEAGDIARRFKQLVRSQGYDFKKHEQLATDLAEMEKLPKTFALLPVPDNTPFVWSDIRRFRTLNLNQVKRNKIMHICPFQIDIVERLIETYTQPGDLVGDPFNGIGTVTRVALEMGREAFGTELNPEYFEDSLYHVREVEQKMNQLTLQFA